MAPRSGADGQLARIAVNQWLLCIQRYVDMEEEQRLAEAETWDPDHDLEVDQLELGTAELFDSTPAVSLLSQLERGGD
jgi:hypothetical protein